MPASPGSPGILLLVTDAFGSRGGIQTYSRALIRTISEWCEETGGAADVLVINDPRDFHDLAEYVVSDRVRYAAFAGSKIRFLAAAVRSARRADLVIYGHVYFLAIAPLLRLINRRVKFRLIAYGVEVWRRLSWLRRSQLRQIDRISCISHVTWSKMAEANDLSGRRAAIHPAPLDPTYEVGSVVGELPAELPPNAHILLTVSRLARTEGRKGIDDVIRVLPRLLPHFPDLYYVVVGDGEDRVRLQDVAESEGVAGHVIFTGVLADADLRSLYNACDMFILLSTKEGFGIVLLEAMHSNKPCIGAAAGGIPEVIVHGETGYLVHPGDRESTARWILQLLSDADLRDQMGRAGRRRYDSQFSFARFRARIRDDLLAID